MRLLPLPHPTCRSWSVTQAGNLHAHTHMRTHAHTHTHTRTHAHTHTCTCTHASTHSHTHASTHTHLQVKVGDPGGQVGVGAQVEVVDQLLHLVQHLAKGQSAVLAALQRAHQRLNLIGVGQDLVNLPGGRGVNTGQ